MASTLLLSVLLTSKQQDNDFRSSLCRTEYQPSTQCAAPTKGFCPGWGEVCCQYSPTRASSANRCSNYAEKGYSCVPKTSCRVGGNSLASRSEEGAWCPGWEEVCCRQQWQLPSCSQYSELGYSCVPKSQCDQGVIVTDGSGILQARVKEETSVQEGSRCPGWNEVCCLDLPAE